MATNVTNNSKVKFVYVPTGKSMPATPDGDTVYFVEGTGQLYVGDHLIADSTDLSGYKVKDVVISGSGNNISNVSFNSSTGVITVTKSSLPSLSKGTDTSGTPTTLTLGGTFSAMTDTSVNGHQITDENTTFTMPNALTDVTLANKAGAAGTVTITVTSSDNGASHSNDVAVYTPGSVTPGDTGLVSGDAVYTAIEDAVEGLSGAMHFLGSSSTVITDGGTEAPTIEGVVVPTADLHPGDVVLYDDAEYVWIGTAWELLGSEGSYALKTVTITGANGLTGGGNLTENRVISHGAAPVAGSPASASAGSTPSTLVALTGVSVDTYGHVAGVTTGDFSTQVNAAIDTKINALDVAEVSGDYIVAISETDGKVSATAGVKGAVAASDGGLVDGGTVYTAVENAATKWVVIS